MTGGVVQRLLFTRTERYLIRNQANPFAVMRKGVRKEQPTYTDSSDYCPEEMKNIENGRYYGQLTANAILSSDDALKKPKKEKPHKTPEPLAVINMSDEHDTEVPSIMKWSRPTSPVGYHEPKKRKE